MVEDEYLIAMEMKCWLLAAGSEVLGPVLSVDQALDLIKEHRPDAAVLDIDLGGAADAYPIAKRLGELDVPYPFATADVSATNATNYRTQPQLRKAFSEVPMIRALGDNILSVYSACRRAKLPSPTDVQFD